MLAYVALRWSRWRLDLWILHLRTECVESKFCGVFTDASCRFMAVATQGFGTVAFAHALIAHPLQVGTVTELLPANRTRLQLQASTEKPEHA